MKRVTELKDLIKDFDQRAGAPTEAHDHLGQVISRSQRSFKELIDSFEDIAFATSLMAPFEPSTVVPPTSWEYSMPISSDVA